MTCSLEDSENRFITMCSNMHIYSIAGSSPWADAGSGVHLVTALLAVVAMYVVRFISVFDCSGTTISAFCGTVAVHRYKLIIRGHSRIT